MVAAGRALWGLQVRLALSVALHRRATSPPASRALTASLTVSLRISIPIQRVPEFRPVALLLSGLCPIQRSTQRQERAQMRPFSLCTNTQRFGLESLPHINKDHAAAGVADCTSFKVAGSHFTGRDNAECGGICFFVA